MVLPVEPHPEGVERGQQEAHTHPLAKRDQVVPVGNHVRDPAADGLFDVAVPLLGVLQHDADHGHAVVEHPAELGLHAGHVLAAVQPVDLEPADRVVVADGREGRAGLVDEIGRVRRDLNPRQTDAPLRSGGAVSEAD
jgi:hypothetical protein